MDMDWTPIASSTHSRVCRFDVTDCRPVAFGLIDHDPAKHGICGFGTWERLYLHIIHLLSAHPSTSHPFLCRKHRDFRSPPEAFLRLAHLDVFPVHVSSLEASALCVGCHGWGYHICRLPKPPTPRTSSSPCPDIPQIQNSRRADWSASKQRLDHHLAVSRRCLRSACHRRGSDRHRDRAGRGHTRPECGIGRA